MKDIIVVIVILLTLGLAIRYIVRAKKNGAKCIGCPSYGNCCSSKSKEESCDCDCCDCSTENK